MKSVLTIIRWKFVIPVALFVAAVILFFIVFFDPLLAKAIEWGASQANEAKVNVDGLHTKLFQGRLSIGRVQVTDKDNVMKNLVEAGPLAFQLNVKELISKRFIIPEASLDGLKFNTDRKVSGALPLKKKKAADEKPRAAARLAEKYKDRFALNLRGMKSDAKEKVEFDPKDSHIVKDAEAIKTKAETAPDEWKKRIDGLQIEERLKKVEADYKEIEKTPTKGPEAIIEIPKSLKKVAQLKSDLEKIKSDVKTTQSDFSAEIKGLKTSVLDLKNSKQKDLNDLLSRFNLDFADPKRLIEGLLGPSVLSKFKTSLHYVEVARAHMPSKKEAESLPPKPREKGEDIKFPTPAALPKFWLEKATLSGDFEDISAKGTLADITTSPPRIGKPMVATLTGSKDEVQFLGKIIADHVTDISKDSLVVEGKNLNLLQVINTGTFGKALKAGRGDVNFSLSVIGESQIGGHIKMAMKKITLDPQPFLEEAGLTETAGLSKEDEIKKQFLTTLVTSMEKMPDILIDAQIIGTWQDPGLTFSSNLDNIVKDAIKKSFGAVVDTQRKELEAKLDKVLDEKRAELNSKLASLDSKVKELLGPIENKVQEEINKISKTKLSPEGNSPIPGLKVPSLDKLFK